MTVFSCLLQIKVVLDFVNYWKKNWSILFTQIHETNVDIILFVHMLWSVDDPQIKQRSVWCE